MQGYENTQFNLPKNFADMSEMDLYQWSKQNGYNWPEIQSIYNAAQDEKIWARKKSVGTNVVPTSTNVNPYGWRQYATQP